MVPANPENTARKVNARQPILFLFLAAAILCGLMTLNTDLTRSALGQTGPAKGQPERTKIAEGEYAIIQQANEGASGPFGEEIYDFHETWTLWKLANGQYEVEGARRFESPRDSRHDDRFVVQLTRDLTVIRMTEFAKLKWLADSGPLTCEFLRTELHCSSGGSDPAKSIQLHAGVRHPYGLLWPVSVFSLSGLTREAERATGTATPVELFTIEQPGADNPVAVTTLGGELRYLGDENMTFANQNWPAHKFSIKVAQHPEFLVWTSQKGLLLAMAIEHSDPHWPEQGMRLVRFQQSSDF